MLKSMVIPPAHVLSYAHTLVLVTITLNNIVIVMISIIMVITLTIYHDMEFFRLKNSLGLLHPVLFQTFLKIHHVSVNSYL